MSEAENSDLLLGYEQIGSFLGMSARQAEWWASSTDLPTFKIGRSVCSRRTTLKAWLDAREKAGRS